MTRPASRGRSGSRSRRLLPALALPLLASARPHEVRRVTLVHFSDYHSHAVPFPSEGEPRAAGIARAVAALKRHASDPSTLVFSGGDMINFGAPVWSDKYGCAEWRWLNGIVSAMAYGNHDADYGPEAFARCRMSASFPILSANTMDAAGQPLFTKDGKRYAVFERNGVKVGVFAVAGPDFEKLIGAARRPGPGARFSDRVEASRRVVAALRRDERADVVVLLGHEYHEDDLALVAAVPGIDVVFGTHSHRKEELTRIPGTDTWTISPFQYLAYLSRVEIEVKDGHVARLSGGLERMSAALPEDPAVAAEVARMQKELQSDPAYAPLFEVIGAAREELSIEGHFERDAPFCDLVVDLMREAAKTQVALLPASTFREAVPAGDIREETLRTAVPYPNRVLVYALPGSVLLSLLEVSAARRGSDAFCQVSGLSLALHERGVARAQLVKEGSLEPLEASRVYSVAIGDYQALVAPAYSPLLKGLGYREAGLEVRDLVRRYLNGHRPAGARRDGRIATEDRS